MRAWPQPTPYTIAVHRRQEHKTFSGARATMFGMRSENSGGFVSSKFNLLAVSHLALNHCRNILRRSLDLNIEICCMHWNDCLNTPRTLSFRPNACDESRSLIHPSNLLLFMSILSCAVSTVLATINSAARQRRQRGGVSTDTSVLNKRLYDTFQNINYIYLTQPNT